MSILNTLSDPEKAERILKGHCGECLHEKIGRHDEDCSQWGWILDHSNNTVSYYRGEEHSTMPSITLQKLYSYLSEQWTNEDNELKIKGNDNENINSKQ